MAQDLTLRLLGRPQVSQNSEVGYRTLKRKYVVLGSRVNFTEIDNPSNPLFLGVGAEDDEFTGFYLVNQSVQPAESTLEKAYLIRDYVEVKNTWLTESISNNGPLGVLTRKYVVLKAAHSLGYGAEEFIRHPKSFGNTLQTDPWDYLPSVIKQSEPNHNLSNNLTLCGTSVSYNWARLNASVDTSSNGIDVWQVSWVEPLRPTGRPTFTLDKQTGLDVMQRSWHLPRAEADNFLNQVVHPCVRIGSPDETYSDFFVTDYRVVPNQRIDTVSTLTLIYTKVKATELAQSYVQSNDLIKLRKKYAVVRGDDATYGYGSNWAKHPENPDRTQNVPSNPWEYAPSWVVQKPEPPTLDFSSAGAGGFSNTPGLVTGYDDGGNEESSSLQSYLQSANLSSEWLKGSATVSKGSGAIDIWSVEWVCHATPYWVLGTSGKNAGSSNKITILDFDEYGIKQTDVGGSVSGSTALKAKTYVFFVVGQDMPEELARISGGSSTFDVNTSVQFNLWVTTVDEDGFQNSTTPITAVYKNAVWRSSTGATIEFPTTTLANSGTTEYKNPVKVADKNPYEIVFDYDGYKDATYVPDTTYVPDGNGERPTGSGKWNFNEKGLARYQGQSIVKMGGRISYTNTSRIGTISGTTNFDATKTQIVPIFSSGYQKIWKVAITYVGE